MGTDLAPDRDRADAATPIAGDAAFALEVLALDLDAEVRRIGGALRDAVARRLRRRGVVVGLSGGIDSACVAALAVAALGPERVFAVHMPERESSPESLALSTVVAETLGIASVVEDVTAALDGLRAYERRDAAFRTAIPGYGPGWRAKLALPGLRDRDGLNVHALVARSPQGEVVRTRLSAEAYLAVVAATNFKQRVRKAVEYFHADRLHFAVAGTPNRLEYDQGFFVKNGDGAADVKPIAHLFKTQVYALARHLGVPPAVCARPPTTDTYSLAQGQDEFYFAVPYPVLDVCLWAKDRGLEPAAVADRVGLSVEQVAWVFRDIDRKRATTRPLHLPPVLLGDTPPATVGGPAGRAG